MRISDWSSDVCSSDLPSNSSFPKPAPPEDAEKTMTAQTAVPTATPLSAALLDRFKALVGPKGWSQDPDIIAPHLREPRDLYAGISPLLLRPANTEEVAAIVTLARETRTKLVPQGGNTGLVGGSIPLDRKSTRLNSSH